MRGAEKGGREEGKGDIIDSKNTISEGKERELFQVFTLYIMQLCKSARTVVFLKAILPRLSSLKTH